MKKIKFILFILLSTHFFVSCDKNELDNSTITKKSIVIDNLKLTISPYSAKQLLIVDSDLDATKINSNLLEIAMLTKQAIEQDPNLINLISEETDKNVENQLKYKDLFSNFKSTQNTYVSQLMNKVNNSDFTHASNNPNSKMLTENYEAAIYIPNMEMADFTLDPLISVGYEVNDALPGMEEYEDHILSFYTNEFGETVEVLLSEDASETLSNPIIIVVNAEIETPISVEDINNGTGTQITKFNLKFATSQYKINHRYDTSSRSEYEIVGQQQFLSNGNYYWQGVFTNSVYYVDKIRIDKVHYSDIGKTLTSLKYAQAFDITDVDQKYVFWNTYEYDWYASLKNLGKFSRNNVSGAFRGRMNYSSDWYAYDPSEVNNNPLNIWHLNSYSGVTYDYTKGMQSFVKIYN